LDAIIETKNLTKKFGDRTVVNQVNLSLMSGEIYGFLGPNGAGKTTTLRMILGLIQPNAGTVQILGHPVSKENSQAKSFLGIVGEKDKFFGDETAREYLQFFAQLNGLINYEQRMFKLLDYFQLTPFMDLLANRFSQGMKRKLNLVRALMGDPKVLILDEPALGLDPHGIRQVRELMNAQRQRGCAVLLSSHILSEIEQTADRVGIIDKGVLLLEGTVDDVRNSLMTSAKLTVKLNSTPEGLNNALQALPGINKVRQEDNTFILDVDPGTDVRVPVSQRVIDLGGLVIEMYLEEASLEEAFIKITQENVNRFEDTNVISQRSGSKPVEKGRP